MSIPSSSSYRSSSVGSTFTPEPHHAAAEDLLAPGGKLGAHIAAADSFQLLRVIGYLCESSHWINDDLKSSLGAAYQELEKKTGKDKFPSQKEALNLALIRGILDSGKINCITTQSLRRVVDSNDTHQRKRERLVATVIRDGLVNSSVQCASKLSIDRRKQVIFDILDADHFDSRGEKALQELNFMAGETSQKQYLAYDPEFVNDPIQILAIRIAETISEDFARRLGEELIAGSHINKIEDQIFNEPQDRTTGKQHTATRSANTSSESSTKSDSDPLEELLRSVVTDAFAKPSAPGSPSGFDPNSSASLSSGLTTTMTAATRTTTTTTTSAPITTTTLTTAPKPARADSRNLVISTEPLSNKSGQQILADFGYPLSLQKNNSRKWKEAAKLVEKFYKHCAPQPGSLRERLMQIQASPLKDSINSLSVISLVSKKGEDMGARLAFEKNISPNADKALNKAILGHSEGYAQRHPDLLTGRSPISTRISVDMIRPDGTIVTPTVVCVSSPALGKNGAELESYRRPDGRLDTDLYVKARREIGEQILANVRSLNASSAPKRVVLSAAGMGEFIAGLSKEDAALATRFAATEMADLVVQLGKENVSVVYTDKDDKSDFWQQVNERLKKNTSVAFVGALPGNWVSDDDIIINSTSGFYQPGHGGQTGKSLDGQFGDTLLFDVHMLRSILYSAGLRPADLAE